MCNVILYSMIVILYFVIHQYNMLYINIIDQYDRVVLFIEDVAPNTCATSYCISIGRKQFANKCILFLFTFYTAFQLFFFCNQGCNRYLGILWTTKY